MQHPDGLGNQEHSVCLYSFAFSFVQTGTSVSVGVILSLQLGHTYCQFRLRLRKERGDRPDSEPHVYIWKIILPNKMDHFLNHRSGLLMNAEPSNPSWGTVKWRCLSCCWLNKEYYSCIPREVESQVFGCVWVTGAHRAAANSPRPTVAHQVSREQKGLFRGIENMDDHPWLHILQNRLKAGEQRTEESVENLRRQ